jgi:hypothetical protein
MGAFCHPQNSGSVYLIILHSVLSPAFSHTWEFFPNLIHCSQNSPAEEKVLATQKQLQHLQEDHNKRCHKMGEPRGTLLVIFLGGNLGGRCWGTSGDAAGEPRGTLLVIFLLTLFATMVHFAHARKKLRGQPLTKKAEGSAPDKRHFEKS